MPNFRWKGRTRTGQEVEGAVDARTKDEVLDSLRRNGIAVTSVTERSRGGEPPDPDRQMLHSTATGIRHDASPQREPNRLRGVLIAFVFAAAGIGVAYLATGGDFANWRRASAALVVAAALLLIALTVLVLVIASMSESVTKSVNKRVDDFHKR